ncbi:MAG: glycerol-3-phosphate acyltransferase [Anaerolineales bacterium]|nr:glycerol-3-phosphate acyltransferase [Anaerolineales bacterium]MCX7609711.1 glycerol-3-phosphate acyltransferase [Anaerolineales bacterium]MDW8227542.1 glycerol-3-phosphate acyltransferase [Anaerolineales bacterium]
MLPILFWSLLGFFLGAVPFSLLMGKLVVGRDIRTVGDGNPGGANALRAGGLKAGIPAIFLDIAKGFLPVYLAQRAGLSGWSLLPVLLAPIVGHAFSPFLGFRGGKALAASGGAWLALIGWWVFPIYALLALPFTLLQTEDAWSACSGFAPLLVYAFLTGEPWMVTFAALNAAVVVWKHRQDLARRPHLRPWVMALLARRGV